MYHYEKGQCPWTCPKCHEDSDYELIDQPALDGNYVYADWRCKCGFEWSETFKFYEWEPNLEDDWVGEGIA